MKKKELDIKEVHYLFYLLSKNVGIGKIMPLGYIVKYHRENCYLRKD